MVLFEKCSNLQGDSESAQPRVTHRDIFDHLAVADRDQLKSILETDGVTESATWCGRGKKGSGGRLVLGPTTIMSAPACSAVAVIRCGTALALWGLRVFVLSSVSW